jgi:8-oxo-dGTP diphosphatase/2-hydroxy-dATP diphosphatase
MKSLKQASLLFLREDDTVLLAMKKRGFGVGRWNGVGGKPRPGEAIYEAAIRECEEEISVTPVDMKHVATLDFYFPGDKSDWNQRVIVYSCTGWRGEPTETEEMRPAWYKLSDIPYENMWSDDKYWLPKVLEGYFVEATFTFDDDDNVIKHSVVVRDLD